MIHLHCNHVPNAAGDSLQVTGIDTVHAVTCAQAAELNALRAQLAESEAREAEAAAQLKALRRAARQQELQQLAES